MFVMNSNCLDRLLRKLDFKCNYLLISQSGWKFPLVAGRLCEVRHRLGSWNLAINLVNVI